MATTELFIRDEFYKYGDALPPSATWKNFYTFPYTQNTRSVLFAHFEYDKVEGKQLIYVSHQYTASSFNAVGNKYIFGSQTGFSNYNIGDEVVIMYSDRDANGVTIGAEGIFRGVVTGVGVGGIGTFEVQVTEIYPNSFQNKVPLIGGTELLFIASGEVALQDTINSVDIYFDQSIPASAHFTNPYKKIRIGSAIIPDNFPNKTNIDIYTNKEKWSDYKNVVYNTAYAFTAPFKNANENSSIDKVRFEQVNNPYLAGGVNNNYYAFNVTSHIFVITPIKSVSAIITTDILHYNNPVQTASLLASGNRDNLRLGNVYCEFPISIEYIKNGSGSHKITIPSTYNPNAQHRIEVNNSYIGNAINLTGNITQGGAYVDTAGILTTTPTTHPPLRIKFSQPFTTNFLGMASLVISQIGSLSDALNNPQNYRDVSIGDIWAEEIDAPTGGVYNFVAPDEVEINYTSNWNSIDPPAILIISFSYADPTNEKWENITFLVNIEPEAGTLRALDISIDERDLNLPCYHLFGGSIDYNNFLFTTYKLPQTNAFTKQNVGIIKSTLQYVFHNPTTNTTIPFTPQFDIIKPTDFTPNATAHPFQSVIPNYAHRGIHFLNNNVNSLLSDEFSEVGSTAVDQTFRVRSVVFLPEDLSTKLPQNNVNIKLSNSLYDMFLQLYNLGYGLYYRILSFLYVFDAYDTTLIGNTYAQTDLIPIHKYYEATNPVTYNHVHKALWCKPQVFNITNITTTPTNVKTNTAFDVNVKADITLEPSCFNYGSGGKTQYLLVNLLVKKKGTPNNDFEGVHAIYEFTSNTNYSLLSIEPTPNVNFIPANVTDPKDITFSVMGLPDGDYDIFVTYRMFPNGVCAELPEEIGYSIIARKYEFKIKPEILQIPLPPEVNACKIIHYYPQNYPIDFAYIYEDGLPIELQETACPLPTINTTPFNFYTQIYYLSRTFTGCHKLVIEDTATNTILPSPNEIMFLPEEELPDNFMLIRGVLKGKSINIGFDTQGNDIPFSFTATGEVVGLGSETSQETFVDMYYIEKPIIREIKKTLNIKARIVSSWQYYNAFILQYCRDVEVIYYHKKNMIHKTNIKGFLKNISFTPNYPIINLSLDISSTKIQKIRFYKK